ncbi:D-tagatose-bisphosphate aldolase, class II, non-catalytic subunit [Sodalis praecaptivus]|uniref:D-tagatose-1,6-bisphosphate aldolase subunit GatZ n=1 Tax=Sodalis praecaptivus TaxID=1239307 RepID=W0HU25_9GAMM|nr:tagatose-bisphosphate aldolase subunit GatZ [Sodalis praecaptivus]AHF77351.1 D-tagatose-bisphosphate aldolase, class II, non-catalytic subunit [Sodalis praecaptivus]
MKTIIARHKQGEHLGICAVCSAHPLVVEAALRFDLHGERQVLIEATSNQVNQFGGYTGMTPAGFRDFVQAIASRVGFPLSRLILGGDHLGPNCWRDETAEVAMAKAAQLVADYVRAGFSKIHLDASMPCLDDPVPLPPETVALRSAQLCAAAEASASDAQRQALCYVIGTEVPVPGGETDTIGRVHVTTPDRALETLTLHEDAFRRLGQQQALNRIIALVVQPGVEFDHSNIIHYRPAAAQALSRFIASTPWVFEAHSTDYQTPQALAQLVQDHFAILKVGPALTFALREAIFSLALMEKALVPAERQSRILEVIDSVMLDEPKYWEQYYHPRHSQAMVDLHYSLSDRIRYYWPQDRIAAALRQLISQLTACRLPLGMLSQYFPLQYRRVLAGECRADPHSLIMDKIQDVLRDYAYGCRPRTVAAPQTYALSR